VLTVDVTVGEAAAIRLVTVLAHEGDSISDLTAGINNGSGHGDLAKGVAMQGF
jgi:hypothetical protein